MQRPAGVNMAPGVQVNWVFQDSQLKKKKSYHSKIRWSHSLSLGFFT